ncbi:sodium-dependent transporter [Anaerobacillus alkaliphilus]|uniref:Sodium-dependent transporter n=1 Tax=Anaerobacillus alkaliphilus TaxID=1548597 RepID=A0A4Q0VUX2_9BACI|nr:sodium-dependent transporter [Anaerobacillus alkaliphilus]RXJ02594.1 sodium-dependent transporter [Anaerobacillus alkaliphilus]
MSKNQWSSKLGFILAAAGSAIGLGAIWKLPYVAGTNGGGAFFLIYLVFIIFLGAPLLISEFIIGRKTQKEAISAYRSIAPNTYWHWIGKLGVCTSIILLSFYSVVGGWVVNYFLRSLTGSLSGLELKEYQQLFGTIISNPTQAVAAHLIFIFLTIIIVQGGVQKGIERATKVMMPTLFVLFIFLVFRSLTLEGALEGVRFILMPNFSDVTSKTFLFALGQAFFALSLGISTMVTYSSYLPKGESLPRSVASVVGLTILISLLAGLAIFPAVFAFGFEPTEGPSLIFTVLPAVFNEMAFGSLFIVFFLALLLFATLTSSISLLEIIVASLTKGRNDLRQKKAWTAGLLIFVLGIPSALSFGLLAEFSFFGRTFFDLLDYLVSNFLLPLGALFVAIFIANKLTKEELYNEMSQGSSITFSIFKLWYFLIRYIVPTAIFLVIVLR